MSTVTLWNNLPPEIGRPSFNNDFFWSKYETRAQNKTIHLAILSRPYLDLILSHEKTVESRFSVDRRSPYKRVHEGDVLLLKQSGGPIRGIAYVSGVWFYRLDDDTLKLIKTEFGKQLQIQDEAFWTKCAQRTYATLIKLEHVCPIPPMKYSKKDRNGWTVFAPRLAFT